MPKGSILNSRLIPKIMFVHDEVDRNCKDNSFVIDFLAFVDAFEFGMQQRLVALLFGIQLVKRD